MDTVEELQKYWGAVAEVLGTVMAASPSKHVTER